MFKKWTAGLALLALLTLTAAAQDAKTVVANATKAMGYDKLNTIEYSGSGFEGTAMGQLQSPARGWPKFTAKNLVRYVDVAAGTGQQSSLRSRPADPASGLLPGGGGLDATNEAQQNSAIAANAGWNARLDVVLLPPAFLKMAAAASNATVKSQGKYKVVSFPVEQKAPSGVNYMLAGYINDQNIVEKVETLLEDNLIGDMVVEQSYSGYKDFAGVKFPTRIDQKRAGLSWTELTITDVKPNAPAPPPPPAGGGRGGGGGGGRGGAAGGAPGGAPGGAGGGRGGGAPAADAAQRGGGAPGGAPGGGGRGGAAAAVGNRKLAEGVYLITGGYRSVAVEFKDHIVLIEAPQNEATTTPILAEAKKAIPNKPITHVINTHTHADHSGGLRAAAAEGAIIVTSEMNKPLYEKWFTNPRTLLVPDTLAKSGRKAKFDYVGDRKILKDDTHSVEIYHIKGALHAEDMIIAYLPKEKIVIEADAFNPPAAAGPPANPGAQFVFWKLFASELDRLKIDYTTIVSVHAPGGGDRDVTKADLQRSIGKGD